MRSVLLQVPFELFLHPLAEHLTLALLDDWTKEAAYTDGRRLVRDPARITYRTEPWLDFPGYEIRHDHAYWIWEITGHDTGPGDYVDVDLTSHGCGRTTPTFVTGRDQGLDPVPSISDFREIRGSEPLPQANRITGTFGNVASLTIDVTGACLDAAPVEYEITADRAVTLTDGRTLGTPGEVLERTGSELAIEGRLAGANAFDQVAPRSPRGGETDVAHPVANRVRSVRPDELPGLREGKASPFVLDEEPDPGERPEQAIERVLVRSDRGRDLRCALRLADDLASGLPIRRMDVPGSPQRADPQ